MPIGTTIEWTDGSGDLITVTKGEGQTYQVSSDPNTGYLPRTQDLTFRTTNGSPTVTRTLSVTQLGKDITLITYNDKAITRSDVAVGYE